MGGPGGARRCATRAKGSSPCNACRAPRGRAECGDLLRRPAFQARHLRCLDRESAPSRTRRTEGRYRDASGRFLTRRLSRRGCRAGAHSGAGDWHRGWSPEATRVHRRRTRRRRPNHEPACRRSVSAGNPARRPRPHRRTIAGPTSQPRPPRSVQEPGPSESRGSLEPALPHHGRSARSHPLTRRRRPAPRPARRSCCVALEDSRQRRFGVMGRNDDRDGRVGHGILRRDRAGGLLAVRCGSQDGFPGSLLDVCRGNLVQVVQSLRPG